MVKTEVIKKQINIPKPMFEKLTADSEKLAVPTSAYIVMLLKQAMDYNDTIEKMKSQEWTDMVSMARNKVEPPKTD